MTDGHDTQRDRGLTLLSRIRDSAWAGRTEAAALEVAPESRSSDDACERRKRWLI
jgi:hypothetical protein